MRKSPKAKTPKLHKLVLLRHGESLWNKENRFTGWVDIGLSEKGEEEALHSGKLLREEDYSFDIAYTSVLKRAIETLEIVLEELDCPELQTKYSWRLNEKHYGALQGLSKSETARKYGERQVKLWRRSYSVRPPELSQKEAEKLVSSHAYAGIKKSEIPRTECLKDTVARFLPYWKNEIAPKIKEGDRVLICAHGNSIRALVKHLDKIGDEDIANINIPTGIPLVYELDGKLKPIRHYYLGNQEQIKKAIEKVAGQGKARI